MPIPPSKATPSKVTPWIAPSVADLVEGASERREVSADDGKSGSTFERIVIDGAPYFSKTLSYDTDWIMRITGDTDLRPLRTWQAGIMHGAPPCIDSTLVGMAVEGTGPSARLTMLMHDVGDLLVPEGDSVVSEAQHLGFVDHLAALSATYWNWRDTLGLTPLEHRVRFFAPDNIAPVIASFADEDLPVPLRAAREGWVRLAERAPRLAELTAAIHHDPAPLVAALRTTPSTFLHGDWKMGNLGTHPDGRTILIDWAYPGEGPAGWDLAWYLALNRARLPMSKEDSIEEFRAALARHGVETGGWFDRQIGLSLVAIMACFGWEKAMGDDDELAWWEDAALAGARWLASDGHDGAGRTDPGPT
jgi:hypothetical protein